MPFSSSFVVADYLLYLTNCVSLFVVVLLPIVSNYYNLMTIHLPGKSVIVVGMCEIFVLVGLTIQYPVNLSSVNDVPSNISTHSDSLDFL